MKEIPLYGKYSQGRVALVDDEDYDRVKDYKWLYSLTNGGKPYIITCLHVKPIYMHRLILKAEKGQIIDHRNGDTTDNRRQNIRFCTQRQNIANKRVFKRKIPYRGVRFCEGRKRYSWQARIKFYDQEIHLGRYASAEDAAYIYDQFAMQLNGEFAQLNFPNAYQE